LTQVFGNTHGLKASQVRQLERLFRRRVPADQLLTQELARQLTETSREIRRQVGVLVDRRGDIQHVMVGDAHSIELPDWGRLRAGRGRLRGLRCLHTHLGGEGLTRDDKTDLLLLRLDAMVTIGVGDDGLPTLAHTAALRPVTSGDEGIEFLEPLPPSQITLDFQVWIRDLEEELSRTVGARTVADGERAILVSVTAGRSAHDLEIHVAELRELARSAGVTIVDVVTQHRPRVDPKTVLGTGKLQDLMVRAFQRDIELVIVDQNLTPSQARNLAERMELRVIDRTQLILDIFAQHATTRDGKLQVELAQLKYRLPRLAQRAEVSLSRLAGGIGGRGPGETKLEVDRRRTRDRITRLERELKKLGAQRKNRRQRRARRDVPVLSIVGYTNAGKSTLLRALTKTSVHVADQMFATLDPVSRRLRFPREREVIITDTVGFIRDLPPDLVTAFRATLEELTDASLLLHVVDVSAPDGDRRIEAVRGVLNEIGIEAPELLVFNQIDKLEDGEGESVARRHDGVAVSALEHTGLRTLLGRAEQMLWQPEGGGRLERKGGLAGHAEA
jgi:GTP-binding protein HflX|tara:strand:- start:133 stop:1812 length:1680 start_codon:yes stop_codon:yes gene_type:complete